MKPIPSEPRFYYSFITVCAAGIACWFFGCNGTLTQPKDNQAYKIAAACIADHNLGRTTVVVDLTKGSGHRPKASLRFGSDSLGFSRPGFAPDSLFSAQFNSVLRYPVGTNRLFMTDGDSSTIIRDTLPVVVTSSFYITQIVPPSRDVRGSLQVSLTWSTADSANGYVIATVLKKNAYARSGYSSFVTSLNTNGTFPPDAFSLSPGPQPDTGWYYVYVYAYSGVPDSTLTSGLLPVPFAHQLSDNVTGRQDISGRYGMIRVALRDSVHVRY